MPGYSELIKNFEKIRDFVRDFFIFGYHSRGDYDSVSARSYDNERRRIQSYLNDFISENWDSRGKTISISSDTIAKSVNPLFKVWETKSFTRNDLFLHFVILDILQDKCLSAPDIADIITTDYLCKLDAPVFLSFHQYKHAFATTMPKRTVNPRVFQEFLVQKDTTTTLGGIYECNLSGYEKGRNWP